MPIKVNLPVKTPKIIKRLYSNYIWDKKTKNSSQKTLYLTFDDGPIPQVTPWVLQTLENFNAQASFFCIGDNIVKHPDVFNLLIKGDHTIGNHTFNHLNGWKTNDEDYLTNIAKTEELLTQKLGQNQLIFRPPYGKIKKRQANRLIEKNYQIVMYDVIAYDWDSAIDKNKCLDNVLNYAEDGSIIVFHDSLKAENNMKYALPRVLEYFSNKGYIFKAL